LWLLPLTLSTMFRALRGACASTNARLAGAVAVTAGAAACYSTSPLSESKRLSSQPSGAPPVDDITESVYGALINRKVNACPMAVRVAWHASGTYDKRDGSGGSNGATMRFQPEHDDPANAGLFIIHDLLLKVKTEFPRFSFADLWTLAGCKAVEFMGGPRIEFRPGRFDAPSKEQAQVPPNGRLPDASQGAAHLREVFGRMGFNDREIVALSGAHTVGRCHKVRSGYDGPWTRNPLRFDNEYFRNLMTLEWKPRQWEGKMQYTDVATETLTMLPTDMALRDDPKFRVIAQEYCDSQAAFFRDFASAFAKLCAKVGVRRVCG
jgi:catalase (peroxidase I)